MGFSHILLNALKSQEVRVLPPHALLAVSPSYVAFPSQTPPSSAPIPPHFSFQGLEEAFSFFQHADSLFGLLLHSGSSHYLPQYFAEFDFVMLPASFSLVP